MRTVGMEPQQHLHLRAAVEEQNRWVRLGGGFTWQEQLRVRFLAILRRKGHGLGHDELGTREGGRDGFRSEPPPLPPRTQLDRMQRLVAVALQCEKSAGGADLRHVFDGVALGGAHRRTMLDIDRPDMQPVGVILSGRIDQALACDAQPLLIDQGTVDSLTWAPDGKRLAFVSHRGNHSLIGVYDFGDQTIVWLSPSLDYDNSPAFSPDGARIAFVHVLAEKAPPDYFSPRSGRPWSIWTADVKTGQGRRVWIADAGPGSVFQPTPSATNLFWTNHDDLVFLWEKSGWLHLYAVPVQGGTARALTVGKFEVTHVVFSQDRKRLVYSSTQDDTDRLHIWTVDAEHGSAVRTDQSHAIEDMPQIGADGALFALQSDGNQLLHPVVLSAGGQWRRLAPEAVPSSFPSSKLVMPQAVTFTAKDGQETHAQLFLPRETTSKPHPAILFFHGGPQMQMLLGFNTDVWHSWIYAFNQYLVAEGYIVLSVNYRGGTGYGLDYREADNFGPGGGSELNDIFGAITYLRGRQDVDSHRLGILGDSYGGLMTELGLARASDALVAGVDYAGIYNWSTFLASVGQPIDGDDTNRRAVESSPVATIDQWHSPVLLVKADGDLDVPLQQTTALIEDLRPHNIEP